MMPTTRKMVLPALDANSQITAAQKATMRQIATAVSSSR